jgi:hypothetical protein
MKLHYGNSLRSSLSLLAGRTRQNYCKSLKKKIKEYKYASKYESFEPLPYFFKHINRTTPDEILKQIMQTAQTSFTFTLDTESINIYRTRNERVSIQMQILLSHNHSMVLIFENVYLHS